MQFSKLISIAALAAIGSAHPVTKRALSDSDSSTLQLALFLEHLEYSFYSGGYNNFTQAQFVAAGFPASFRDNVGVIASHEKTHADTISSVLSANGVTPIPTCTYSFPYNDPKSFASLSNMITSVGIGAYIGGASKLTDSLTLLTTAGSILTTESRHDTYIRTGLGASPFPTPFDTALTALWAYNLAHMFIVSCPQELPGQVLLPQLKLVSPTPPQNLQPPTPAGTTLTFSWDPSKFFVTVDPNAPFYIAFINQNVENAVFEQVTKTGTGSGTVKVPQGVSGVAFAVLTTFSSGLDENALSQYGTLAGPAEVVLS